MPAWKFRSNALTHMPIASGLASVALVNRLESRPWIWAITSGNRKRDPLLFILATPSQAASNLTATGLLHARYTNHCFSAVESNQQAGQTHQNPNGGIAMARKCGLWAAVIIGVATLEAAAKHVDVRNPETRARAVAAFRAQGPEGLDAALRLYDELEKQYVHLQEKIGRLDAGYSKAAKSAQPDPGLAEARRQLVDVTAQLASWREAIDEIGGQRTCTISRLYWYTDMAEAQAAANRTGRPILSLRMLGKLTEEFSCANSRFFRTALYSNTQISRYLRDNYVLHWQSVRPVPRVTIDFGDGRKLERTLTGNSAHYVLTSDGQPLDVLPGLYSPGAFGKWLDRMRTFHNEYRTAAPNEQAETLVEFHRDRRALVYRQWAEDVKQLGDAKIALVTSRIDQAIESAAKSDRESAMAVAASRLAVAKMAAETPLLRYANYSGPWINTAMDDGLWREIANLHRDAVALDESSVGLMRREFPKAADAGRLAVGKSMQEDPLLRMVRLFEDSMALDMVRNEYLLHRRIHERFVDSSATATDVDTLNEWVYAELFLTPSSDPWLGLAPRDVYTALDGDGRTEAAYFADRSQR
jgi:hypothetical protein